MFDLTFLNLFFFLCFYLNTVVAFAGPGVTTYQAKIIKPDGYPLEASSVNFKFSILNPAGSCVLYAETFSTVNMNATGGVISFALGSGVKTYPASATTFEQVFSNISPSLSCDVGGPVSYSPGANDIRKIIMQFHDGSGWQTLPAMSINAVPYAMYASDSATVGGLASSAFVQNANLPTCSGGQALFYNGTSFSCVAMGGGGVTSSTIAAALGYTPADGASITAINSSLSTVSSSVGTANSVITAVSSTVYSVSSTVSALQSSVTSLSNSVAASFAAMTSSQWTTSGTSIGYLNGNVGVGNYTSNANYKFQVHGGASAVVAMVSTDASSNAVIHVASDLDGTPKYGAFGYDFDDNVVKLVNDGSFNTSLKGIMINPTGYVGVMTVSPTARLHIAAGSTSVAPLKFTSGALQTSASSGSVEYDGFNFYITDGTNTRRAIATDASVAAAVTSSSITTALGYTAANSATVNSLSGTVTTLQGAIASMAGSQWATSGTSINFTSGNVGIGTSTPSQALDVSGSVRANKFFAGDGVFNAPSLTFANNPNTGFYNASGWLGVSVAGGLKGMWTSSSLGFNSGGAGPQIYFTGGDETHPSYAFNVDSDTGMFNPNGSGGSNELGFSTSGVERVRFTGAGTVGIGTSAPVGMLNVVNNNASADILNLKAAPSQSGHWIRMQDSSGTTRAVLTPNGNMPQLALGVTNSIRLTAEYSGTDEMPAGAAISTGGNLDLMNSGNPGVKTMAGYFNGTNFLSSWEIANVGSGYGSLLLMKSGGYVGIGVSATSARLHIASGTSAMAPLKIVSGTLLASPQPGAIEYDGNYFWITDGAGTRRSVVGDTGNGTFNGVNNLNSTGNITATPTGSFVVSSTTAATSYTNGALIVKGGVGITGDTYMKGNLTVSGSASLAGWVGIGTTAPRQILDVAPATGNSIIRATSTNGTSALQLYRNTAGTYTGPVLWANGADLNFGWDSSENSGPTLMTLQTNGWLGIGNTSPEAALHVVNNGKILVDTGTTSQAVMTFRNLGIQQWNMGIDAADNKFKISSYNSTQDLTQNTRLVIDPVGYVGIGTSAPTETLHVLGSVSNPTTGGRSVMGQRQISLTSAPSTFFQIATQGLVEILGTNTQNLSSSLGNGGIIGLSGGVAARPGSTGTLSNAFGIKTNISNSGSMTFSNAYGFGTAVINSGGGSINFAAGIAVSGVTTAQNNTQLLLGSYTIPTGNYGIYNSSLYDNYFAGNIAIGVSGVASAPLDVAGFPSAAENIRLRGKSAIEGGEIALMDGTGSGAWEIDNYGASGTERLRIFRDKGENNLSEPFIISPNGYVGINDTSPMSSLSINSALNINAGSNFANKAAAIRISDGSSIGMLIDTNQIEQTDSSNYLYLNYNSSAPTVVNYGGGYAGIGVVPQRLLHIGKPVNAEFVIEQTDALANYKKWNFVVDSGNATTPSRMYIRQLNDALNGGNTVMTMTASGNVGVNTATPGTKLEVANNTAMISNGTGATFAIRAPNSANSDYFQVGWISEDNWGIMTADTATHKNLVVTPWGGNFGVGVIGPAYKLDVAGDIHITGTPYRDSGDIVWTVPSDARLKDVTGKYNRGLREIASIDTITYKYKKDNPKKVNSSTEYTGVLAQQVQMQIPEAVKTDNDGFLSLNTTPIFWAMVNALKEVYYDIVGIKAENAQLKVQAQEQARKIQSLEEENQAIKDRLERIEKSLQQNNK